MLPEYQLLHFKYRKPHFILFNWIFSIMQSSTINLRHHLWNRKNPEDITDGENDSSGYVWMCVSASTAQSVTIFSTVTRLNLTVFFTSHLEDRCAIHTLGYYSMVPYTASVERKDGENEGNSHWLVETTLTQLQPHELFLMVKKISCVLSCSKLNLNKTLLYKMHLNKTHLN